MALAAPRHHASDQVPPGATVPGGTRRRGTSRAGAARTRAVRHALGQYGTSLAGAARPLPMRHRRTPRQRRRGEDARAGTACTAPAEPY